MKKITKIVSINLAITTGLLLFIEGSSFLVFHLESKMRSKNKFQRDPEIGIAISETEFENSLNSKYWAYNNNGRYLTRSCAETNNDQRADLIISGGSTTFPLAVVHSGQNGTWIDHLIRKLSSEGVCVNVFSISMPGFNSSDELRSLKYFLSQNILRQSKKTFLVSFSGINEIKSNHRQLTVNRLQFPLMPYFQWLLNKIIQLLSYSQTKESIRVMSNINRLVEYDESFLSRKQISDNAKEWLSNVNTMNALAKSHSIHFISILQPTLGINSNPENLANLILAQKNIQQSILNANLFSNGYYYGINLLYDQLSEYCNTMQFCVDGSNSDELMQLNVNPDLYSDYRHPNSNGNKKIAKFIYSKINSHLAIP